jgi:hypothetical protein
MSPTRQKIHLRLDKPFSPLFLRGVHYTDDKKIKGAGFSH